MGYLKKNMELTKWAIKDCDFTNANNCIIGDNEDIMSNYNVVPQFRFMVDLSPANISWWG